MVLEDYAKNKEENLKKLLGFYCYTEQMQANNLLELSEENNRVFPIIKFEPEPVTFSRQVKTKEKTEEKTEEKIEKQEIGELLDGNDF